MGIIEFTDEELQQIPRADWFRFNTIVTEDGAPMIMSIEDILGDTPDIDETWDLLKILNYWLHDVSRNAFEVTVIYHNMLHKVRFLGDV